MFISYGVQAVAADAALAVVLCDQLSAEVRDALAGPWVAVFGDPFAVWPRSPVSRVAADPFVSVPHPTGDVPAE